MANKPVQLPAPIGYAILIVTVILLLYVVYINTVAPCFGNKWIPAAAETRGTRVVLTGEEKKRACKRALAGLALAALFGAIGINAFRGRNPGIDGYAPQPGLTINDVSVPV